MMFKYIFYHSKQYSIFIKSSQLKLEPQPEKIQINANQIQSATVKSESKTDLKQ